MGCGYPCYCLDGSGLAVDTFVLMIQTHYQKEVFEKYGHGFAGIDATHNTTHYENMSLFTVIIQDNWGHGEIICYYYCTVWYLMVIYIKGCLIAWMISSNVMEATIDFFLGTLCETNPKVILSKIMSDFDKAQINAIRNCYPESQVFLCWWHVNILHTWQQHIVISHYPELWNLLKGWIHLMGEAEFNECWTKIQALAPTSFIEYIQVYWLPEWPMWSAWE